MPDVTLVRRPCINPRHDHTTMVDRDGASLDSPILLDCNDCGLPTHYDETIESYCHDDPNARACFMSGVVWSDEGHTECVYLSETDPAILATVLELLGVPSDVIALHLPRTSS